MDAHKKDKYGNSGCNSLCTNDGRYCADDPDGDLEKEISRAYVFVESLPPSLYLVRILPRWCWYALVGCWYALVGLSCRISGPLRWSSVFYKWSLYQRCDERRKCRLGCRPNKYGWCRRGLEDCESSILEAKLVAASPSLFVNNAPFRASLTAGEVLDKICAGYVADPKPELCREYRFCGDVRSCVALGRCSTSMGSGSLE